MRTKLFSLATVALAAIVLATAVIFGGSPARAATEAQIETAIQKGLTWLDAQQQSDGHFQSSPTSGRHAAATCLALVKFEHRGWEKFPPPGQGPFDPGYQYRQTVLDGLNYAFGQMTVAGNFVHVQGQVYETGICMMAVAASRSPTRTVPALGSQVDGWTYKAVLQAMMAWMEDAQNAPTDPGPPAACCWGGWGYSVNDCGSCDNSNSGYATMGIGFAISPAHGFGLTVSPSVLTNLNTFVNNVQNPTDGCAYYRPCGPYAWPNILKQGNLLYEMALLGRPVGNATVVDAKVCMENNWNQPPDVGWQGGPGQGYYQAMFTMMKGLEGYGIETLGAGIADWFDEVSTYIVGEQNTAGYWTGVGFGASDLVLETSWALLTLEKAVPIVVPTGNKYCISGTSTGVGWDWAVTGSQGSFNGNVPDGTVAPGGTAVDVVTAWADSMTTAGVNASQFAGGVANCFKITPKGQTLTVDTCTVTDNKSGCSFNPTVIDVTDVGVGGIVELLVDSSDAPASAAAGSGSSSPPYAAIAGAAAAAALAITVGGWYARRRLS